MKDLLEKDLNGLHDPTQPFLQAIYHLTKTHGNDYVLGSKVRELISRFEEIEHEKELDKLNKLQHTFTDGKN